MLDPAAVPAALRRRASSAASRDGWTLSSRGRTTMRSRCTCSGRCSWPTRAALKRPLRWAASSDRWHRRAAAVSLIHGIRRGLFAERGPGRHGSAPRGPRRHGPEGPRLAAARVGQAPPGRGRAGAACRSATARRASSCARPARSSGPATRRRRDHWRRRSSPSEALRAPRAPSPYVVFVTFFSPRG